jgi:hypothetical protein
VPSSRQRWFSLEPKTTCCLETDQRAKYCRDLFATPHNHRCKELYWVYYGLSVFPKTHRLKS